MTSATMNANGRPRTPHALDIAVGSLAACALAVLVWGFGQVAHYAQLDEQRRDILCERGLSLLASTDPADVARGEAIVGEESCPIVLQADGTIPASTAKLDAYLAAHPDGLDELMTIKRRDRDFAGPNHADPFLWITGAMGLGVLLLGWFFVRTHGLLYDREGRAR